jgi:hypothetical protein
MASDIHATRLWIRRKVVANGKLLPDFLGIVRGGIIGAADETIGAGAEFISEWNSWIRSITGCGS